MGRKPRRLEPGEIHHVIQRGHNRSYIFNEHRDKVAFLDFLKAAKVEMPFNLLYYVLMDNHYHLIVEMQAAPFQKAMHRIHLAYSKYYNDKYQCTGTVYGERYKTYHVKDAAYLIQLILYIANNPVKAGIVRHPAAYRWCAHKDILSGQSDIVSTERLFEVLGGSGDKGRNVYEKMIRRNFTSASQAATPIAFHEERRTERLQALLVEMLAGRTTVESLRCGRRDARSSQLRREFVGLASDQGYKVAEIADVLQVSDRCVRGYRLEV
jgi:putative transposase